MRGHFEHEKAIYEITEGGACEIIKKKKAAYYGIAVSVRRICKAIVRDE